MATGDRSRLPVETGAVHPPTLPTQTAPPTPVECLLSDGSTITIRSILPEDMDRHRRFIEDLTPDAMRMRFFVIRDVLTEDETWYFTHVNQVDRIGLVAIRHDEVVGIGRFDRTEPTSAEVAFVVSSAVQGLGVATLLLDRLVTAAVERGIHEFTARCLGENDRMMTVFRDSGLPMQSELGGGEWLITLDLRNLDDWKRQVDRRDAVSIVSSLRRILEPRNIGIIGVGRSPESLGRIITENLLSLPFAGKIFPINANADVHVGDLQGVRRITECTPIPDVVVVSVPASGALAVVEECGQAGVAGLVVITAGFAETGPVGREVEREVVARAHAYGMRIVGPNCIGVINAGWNLNATFMEGTTPLGNIGFASQSGAMGIALLKKAREEGIGVSSFVSLGNAADVQSADVIRYWQEDPKTSVGLLYLESLGNPRTFLKTAAACSRTTPIVALKSGSSAIGQHAAQSHTAAAATPDVAVDAVLSRAGVMRAHTLEELLETVTVLSTSALPLGRRIGIVSNAGGAAILAADACSEMGLAVPELPEPLQELLLRSGAAGVRNPIDLGAGAVPETYGRVVAELADRDAVDIVIVIIAPLPRVPVPEVVAAVSGNAAGKQIPVVVVTLGTPTHEERVRSAHVPLIAYPENAARAIANVVEYVEWRSQQRHETSTPLTGVDYEAAFHIVANALQQVGPGWLAPEDTFNLLSQYGVPVAEFTVTTPKQDVAARAASNLGFPVVIKGGGAELLHKTDRGGVVVGVRSKEAVRRAVQQMTRDIGDDLTSVLVQQMVTEDVEEVIIGGINDPNFGPMVMVGTGGILSDVVHDSRFAAAPVDTAQALRLLTSTRVATILKGVRGKKPFDTDAIVDVVVRIGQLLADRPEIAELDCNPVMALHTGAVVVDARIRLRPVIAALESIRVLGG